MTTQPSRVYSLSSIWSDATKIAHVQLIEGRETIKKTGESHGLV